MNKVKIILAILPIVFITACVDKEKNKLDNRVMDYWKFKINKNFKEAYEFLSPGGKQNETIASFEQRMSKSSAKWLEAKIAKKECSQKDLCKVHVNIKYEYAFKGMTGETIQVDSSVVENWIMKNNIWYIVLTK